MIIAGHGGLVDKYTFPPTLQGNGYARLLSALSRFAKVCSENTPKKQGYVFFRALITDEGKYAGVRLLVSDIDGNFDVVSLAYDVDNNTISYDKRMARFVKDQPICDALSEIFNNIDILPPTNKLYFDMLEVPSQYKGIIFVRDASDGHTTFISAGSGFHNGFSLVDASGRKTSGTALSTNWGEIYKQIVKLLTGDYDTNEWANNIKRQLRGYGIDVKKLLELLNGITQVHK